MQLAAVAAMLAGVRAARAESATAWQAVAAGGHLVLLRHALAPGTGDPQNFRLDDCATQRNLSDEGRDQARAIGAAFRRRDIAVGGVLSSQWCRCLETARLLDLGPVTPLPALNSFFRRTERRAPQMAALKEWIAALEPGPSLVLVTHQVNITAATGVFPASGEGMVVRPDVDGELTLVGRLPAPPV